MIASSNPMSRFLAAIVNWSPFVMVIAYLVFAFFLYCFIPQDSWTVVWYVYISIQTACAFMGAWFAIASRRSSVLGRRALRKAVKEGFSDLTEPKLPHIDVVLVSHATRLRDSLAQQARYILEETDYPAEKLHVNVVYDSNDERVHGELGDVVHKHSNMRIFYNQEAVCPADHINYFLSLPAGAHRGHITSLFNSGHLPHPSSFRFVARRFNAGNVDMVQGRRCISNPRPSLISRFAAAEFDTFYGLFYPGRSAVGSTQGIFTDSYGHWSTTLLQTLKMQDNNDNDAAMRALLSSARVVYDLNVVSYEASPESLSGYINQRSYWAAEWTQMVGKYTGTSLIRGPSFIRRLELFSTLSLGALYHHFLIHLVAFIVSSLAVTDPSNWPYLYDRRKGFPISVWLLAFNIISIVVMTAILYRNRAASTPGFAIIVFGFLSPLWLVGVSMTAVASQFRAIIEPRPSPIRTTTVDAGKPGLREPSSPYM